MGSHGYQFGEDIRTCNSWVCGVYWQGLHQRGSWKMEKELWSSDSQSLRLPPAHPPTSPLISQTFHGLKGVQCWDRLMVDEVIVLLGRIIPEDQE